MKHNEATIFLKEIIDDIIEIIPVIRDCKTEEVPKELNNISDKIKKLEEFLSNECLNIRCKRWISKEELFGYIIFFSLSDGKEPCDIFRDFGFFDGEVERYKKLGILPRKYCQLPLYGENYKLTMKQVADMLQLAEL